LAEGGAVRTPAFGRYRCFLGLPPWHGSFPPVGVPYAYTLGDVTTSNLTTSPGGCNLGRPRTSRPAAAPGRHHRTGGAGVLAPAPPEQVHRGAGLPGP